MTFNDFGQLDDAVFFTTLVKEYFGNSDWSEVTQQVNIEPIVNDDRVSFAYKTYQNNLNELRIRLDSHDPDHYKRAACLLDSLNRAQVVQDIKIDGGLKSELEAGTAFGLSYDDCQYRLKFVDFFVENSNQAISFDLAFRCCQTYESNDKRYSPNYFENIIYYLCENDGANVGSLYMILKSYWE